MDVAAVLRASGAASQGLATANDLRRNGVSAGALARAVDNGSVVRLHRRVYSCAPLPALPRLVVTEQGAAPEYVVHVRAALLALGPGAVAHGRTAAALRGWPLLVEPARTIEAAVPHGSRRTTLRHVRAVERRQIERTHDRFAHGLPVTSAVQTVLDCCRSLPLVEAVVVCDSALRSHQVTVEELGRSSRELRGLREARRVREVLAVCDPLSGSVLESVLRVRMLLAGLAGFETQVVLGAARVDFCFREQRLVIEVDGKKWHPDPAADRRRDNGLVALGWRVLRYTWAEVMHDTAPVLAEIMAALQDRTDDGQMEESAGSMAA
jgi:very-short-patch-repair endonuclease